MENKTEDNTNRKTRFRTRFANREFRDGLRFIVMFPALGFIAPDWFQPSVFALAYAGREVGAEKDGHQ